MRTAGNVSKTSQSVVRRARGCIAMFSVLLLSGCVLDSGSVDSGWDSNARVLSGVAVLEGPIVGATVAVEDTNGTVLYSETKETHTTGFFVLHTPKGLPADFDVVVTGGTIGDGGSPMTDVIRLEVRAHNHENYGFYLIDPVSTLVSTYRKAHSGITHTDAVAAIWRYLDLPASVDAKNDLYYLERYFARGAFMFEARNRDGLQAYATELVSQMDNPNLERPCFSSKCGNGLVTGAAGFVAGAIAKGALAYVGGEAAGYIMKEVGLVQDPPPPPGEIVRMLTAQAEQISNVLSEVKKLNGEVQAATEKIINELKATHYDLKAAGLINFRSFIEASYEKLYAIANTNPDDPSVRTVVAELANQMQKRDLETDLITLQNTLATDAIGESGLLDIWADIQHTRGRDSNAYPDLEAWLNYWFDIQVKGLTLLMEYYHYTYPKDNKLAASALKSFDTRFNVQANKFLTAAESMVHVDGGFNYPSEFPNFPYKERLALFCRDFTKYCVGKSCEEPLRRADSIINTILGKPRSLTVRIYKAKVRKLDNDIRLADIELKVKNKDAGLQLTARPTVNDFQTWPMHASYSVYQDVEVARYVFENVPEGRFYIQDDPNYPTITTSASKQSFIDKNTLTYDASADPHGSIAVLGWASYYLLETTAGCSTLKD